MRLGLAVGLVLAAGGCRQAPAPGAGSVPAAIAAPLPGLSALHLALAEAPPFADLLVIAHAPSKLQAPLVGAWSAEAWDADARAGKPAFRFLPSAPDLVVRAYARDAAGLLLAGGEVAAAALAKGPNDRTLRLSAKVGAPRLLRGSDGVSVRDGSVIKGIAVDVATGLPADLPGIDRIAISLAGPAYGDGRQAADIAIFKAPAITEYTWRPANSSLSFDPDKLGTQPERTPFTLTTRALDAFGNELGRTELATAIVGTAQVDVGFGS